MPPALRLHLVTLGVEDVARAADFYEKLGMKRHLKDSQGVAFFDAGGAVISLYDITELADDAGIEELPGMSSGAITLAFNVGNTKDVDEVLASAMKAGGNVLKWGFNTAWGGYIGYFTDLDGHVWEVAHNPRFPFDERGLIALP